MSSISARLIFNYLKIIILIGIFSRPEFDGLLFASDLVDGVHTSFSVEDVQEAISRSDILKRIAFEAKAKGVRVSLTDSTAERLFRYVGQSIAEGKNSESYRSGKFDFSLESIFFFDDTISFQVDGNSKHAMEMADFIQKQFALEPYRIEIRTQAQRKRIAQSTVVKNPIHDFSLSLGTADQVDQDSFLKYSQRIAHFDYDRTAVLQDKAVARRTVLELIEYLESVFWDHQTLDESSLENIRNLILKMPIDLIKPSSSEHSELRSDEHDYYNQLSRALDLMLERSYDRSEASVVLGKLNFNHFIESLFPVKSGLQSLHFLMREILLPEPVGLGSGATAKDLGISLINHQVRDNPIWPLNFQAMTRRPDGIVNAYISSPKFGVGHYGRGLYTSEGRNLYYGRGVPTIYLKLNPDAREGSDFSRAYDENGKYTGYITVKNRRVVSILNTDEPLTDYSKFSFTDLFRFSLLTDNTFNISDPNPALPNPILTPATAENRRRAYFVAQEKSKNLSFEEKKRFTDILNQIAERVRKNDSTYDFYKCVSYLNLESNYVGDLTSFFQNQRSRVDRIWPYLEWFERKYAYDRNPETVKKLAAFSSAFPAFKSSVRKYSTEVIAHEFEESAKGAADGSAEKCAEEALKKSL